VRLAIETGMRRGEILALRWRNVSLAKAFVTVVESKNGYSRTVPLNLYALRILQEMRGITGPEKDNLVFPITPMSLRLAWNRLLRRAGIDDLHFHDLRHEAISRFFELGLTVPEVASISGHRDMRM